MPLSNNDRSWLQTQFDKLRNQNIVILKNIDDVETAVNVVIIKIDGMQTLVDPALENQIRRAAGLARFIDRKVPDQT